MRKFLSIILTLFLTTALFPQGNVNEGKAQSRPNKGILFNFNGLNLNEFNGGVGGKSWLNKSLAFVGSIDLDLSEKKKEGSETQPNNHDSYKGVELRLGLEKHLHIERTLFPFIGGELGVGYNNRLFQRIYTQNNKTYGNENKEVSTIIFANLTFGIEYFIVKNISFAGKYSFRGFYSFGKLRIRQNEEVSKQDTTGNGLSLGASSLILTIYF